ncbi:hypothetical protein QUC32_22960 [Novosphingobium resinovorum]|uniref:hypothetical protein n=1 Tax=Novosphingobium TaxID=165696 RepID=UPI001B3C4D55|nr:MULTISPECIES: hypothetical protein [Novosphingobium]MBF7012511.1 hypothetical protein [Novosphingobium sp. HR1a]WJM27246.1 hypothetical protein QUC32_22960 [Novosphingobium resinovorum]
MNFNRTHYRRSDGLRAQLLGRREGRVVYRIQLQQGRNTMVSTVAASEAHFDAKFTEVAA